MTKSEKNHILYFKDEHSFSQKVNNFQETLDEAIAIMDRSAIIIAVSESFCKLSGYDRAELLGQPASILNSNTHDPAFFKAMWDAVSSNMVWNGQICNRTKLGALYRINATIEPLVGISDCVEAYLVIWENNRIAFPALDEKIAENIYRSGSIVGASSMTRIKIVADITAALKNNEIDIAMQPQINLKTMRHSGFEALLRHKFNAAGITTEQLIEIAESNQLGIVLGDAVITRACKIHNEMKSLGFMPGVLSLNVAGSQLRDLEFGPRLIETCKQFGLSPSEMCIEITEGTSFQQDENSILSNVNYLHENGISIALDDFGTGYASLSQLTSMPVDAIKLDRSFIMNMTSGCKNSFINEALIKLAKNLNIKVVAEGIETVEQLNLLKQMGCNFGQGYYISRPIEVGDLIQYCKEQKSLSNKNFVFA